MIKTVIIDDEMSSLNVLSLLLQKHCPTKVEIIGRTTSPLEGLEMIKSLRPDLIFLDIEMPGMTGLQLVKSLREDFKVVFITAYDAYAVEAFELCAIDYLLKPIASEKLVRVIDKVVNTRDSAILPLQEKMLSLERLFRQHLNNNERISIPTTDKIIFIRISDIVFCEARGAYTNISLTDGNFLLSSRTLGDFETQLQPFSFFRIHHSYLINLNQVKEFQRIDGGYVMLENGTRLEVSTRKRKDFLEAIRQFVI